MGTAAIVSIASAGMVIGGAILGSVALMIVAVAS